ncbi:MAG: hypothetical protein QGH60_25380, partial [Phycisphaerae bacterium]|nr:hypothetical protein [Phycisphaerae bacterium]
RIVSGGKAGFARIWDVSTGREVEAREIGTGTVHSVSFSPDGKHIAFTGPGNSLTLADRKDHSLDALKAALNARTKLKAEERWKAA